MAKKKEVVTRTLAIRADETNDETRSIELSFSSEEPYQRYSWETGQPYYEVLGHKEGEVDTSFIGSGRAPLLLDHWRDNASRVGVVQSVSVGEGRAKARVRFSRTERGIEAFEEVKDGTLVNVSVGYHVLEQEDEGMRDGIKVVRVTKWKPVEISLVSIPADETVGVGRADEQQEAAEQNNNQKDLITMTEETKTPTPDVEAIKRAAAQEAQERVSAIYALGVKHSMQDEAEKFVKEGKSVDAFRAHILDKLPTETKKDEKNEGRSYAIRTAPAIVTEREKGEKDALDKFSITKAVRAAMDPMYVRSGEADYELGLSRELAQQENRKDVSGIYLPFGVLCRSYQTRANTDPMAPANTGFGSQLVGTEYRPDLFVHALRNKSVTAQTGATWLTGLTQNISIPKETTEVEFAMVGDGNTKGNKAMGTSVIPLSPKHGRVRVDVTRGMVLQGLPAIESLIQGKILGAVGRGLDKQALYGDGEGFNVTGLIEQVGVLDDDAFTGADPTFAELVLLQGSVAATNAEVAGSFALNEAQKHRLRAVAKDSGSGRFVVENNAIDGYNVYGSNQIVDGDVWYSGNWGALYIAMWGGVDLIVDPYTGADTGNTRLVGHVAFDVAVSHAEAFKVGQTGSTG